MLGRRRSRSAAAGPTTRPLLAVTTNNSCGGSSAERLQQGLPRWAGLPGWAGLPRWAGLPGWAGLCPAGSSLHLWPSHASPRNALSCQECGAVGAACPARIPLLAGGAGQKLARGCVVPGVTSAYRRIPDACGECSSDSWEGDGELKGLRTQVPLPKLAFLDSGVEMAVGDSSWAIPPRLSQDSLDSEPVGSPEPLVLPMEPSAHWGRLLASRKLERVLERSSQLPISPASLSHHHRSPKPTRKPEYEMPPVGARDQGAANAETDLEAGLGEAEVGRGIGPEAGACPPGQGLHYLEHLCLVLEQMVRLQQLHLQLQAQRPPGGPVEKEESTVAPSPPPSHAPGSEVRGSWELLSQTQETGEKGASLPKVGVPSANPFRLSRVLAEPAHTFQSSQSHKRDLSHWNKVKVLLNRIRWKSPQHPEPPAPPNGPAFRVESRDLPCRPLRKTFMPSLVVKKQRAKNLSVS